MKDFNVWLLLFGIFMIGKAIFHLGIVAGLKMVLKNIREDKNK